MVNKLVEYMKAHLPWHPFERVEEPNGEDDPGTTYDNKIEEDDISKSKRSRPMINQKKGG